MLFHIIIDPYAAFEAPPCMVCALRSAEREPRCLLHCLLHCQLQHSGSVQQPYPPCDLQVKSLLTILLVQPEIKHGPAPPPCLAQRPLRLEVVVQPATEHGFWFPPPCFLQSGDARLYALVMQPSNWHVPLAPCLTQRLRACASVVQPFTLHTFVLPPLCLPHLPLALTAVGQLK